MTFLKFSSFYFLEHSSKIAYLINHSLVHLCISEGLLDRLEGLPEQVGAQFLESGPGDLALVVDALVQRVDFDDSLRRGRERSLGSFASGAESSDGSHVVGDVFARLALEFRDAMVHHSENRNIRILVFFC